MKIEFINFSNEYASFFNLLNKAWIEQYFELEPVDLEVLGDPQKFIIDHGGYIFFAKVNNDIVGTFAMVKQDEGVFELSKMAVSPEWQGRKIGNSMISFCIAEARKLGARKLILYSNTLLRPAIHLYEKFGFKEIPLGQSEFRRTNIKMELNLK